MAATVNLSEVNLVGAIITDNVSNVNFGGNDRPNIDFATAGDKIVAGFCSYLKYMRLHVASRGSPAVNISGIRVWKNDGTYPTALGIASNICPHYLGNYPAEIVTAYATPVATPSVSKPYTTTAIAEIGINTRVYCTHESDPGQVNLGIAGSLIGTINTDDSNKTGSNPGYSNYSDYWVMQLYTQNNTPTGQWSLNTSLNHLTYSWNEA